LKWLQMHILKIRCKCECTSMDQYGKSNWIPLCFLAWTFQMHNRKQCWSLDHEQRYPNFLQILIYFAFSNPNQEDYIIGEAKCLVFLWFSQETLVFISKVPETQYQPVARPCSCKTPCQPLICFSCPHRLLLVFGELMLGYVTPMDWYVEDGCMGPKRSSRNITWLKNDINNESNLTTESYVLIIDAMFWHLKKKIILNI
jgi:hypothetical protein